MQDIYAATIAHYLAPLRAHLDDATVSEVMVNAPDEIYVERAGQLVRTDARFADRETYEAAINNILQYTGRNIDETRPLVDARLPDGSRVHVARSPCARHGTVMTIRKFARDMLDMDNLVDVGTLTPQASEYLHVAVAAEQNMLVSGGTSSGKTSLLNALSRFIPPGQRIVVIEDSAELQLQQGHVISLEARAADAHGRGGVPIRELFRSSLRLRPDRIVIGEVRGGEALDMIQAMTSGHGGSLGTIHATGPTDALSRLETLALMSQVELPLHALRAQAASAIDLIVQMQRQLGGNRIVTQITEIVGLRDDSHYELRDIFNLAPLDKQHAPNDHRMALRWTGQPSAFADRLNDQGRAAITDATADIFKKQEAPHA